MSLLKINLGSGNIPPKAFCAKGTGWTNVDFAYEPDKEEWQYADYMKFDITQRWNIKAETVDCIFASHILEHIQYDKLQYVIAECFRVLKAGSPIRIICPNPRIFIENWRIDNRQFLIDSYGKENCEKFHYAQQPYIGFTDMFFGDHYAHAVCPSIDTIMIMMIRERFKSVAELNYGNTQFPQYFGTGQDDKWEQTCDNRPSMSFYLEGVK